ncbi:hypothetical protein HU200_049980 [Digitaria exilis]|uniref:Uncharacterized protein n=1 Tax=Digitaria exilis TaxID=1010633 RepID=A0A835E7X1_9POAL|nr:hypothetical protein HU200_049980 [Digitaria exilis]
MWGQGAHCGTHISGSHTWGHTVGEADPTAERMRVMWRDAAQVHWDRPAPGLRRSQEGFPPPPPPCSGISGDPSALFTAYLPPASQPATPSPSTGEFHFVLYLVP